MTLCFTKKKKKTICSIITKSQNITNMVVYKIFFRFLCFKELELLKTVISDWNLLYLSQKDPEPNLKGFQYQI